MKKILHALLFTSLCYTILSSAAAIAAERVYTVAVVPQFAATKVYTDWTPLLAKLEEATGLRFQLLVYKDFPLFESEFASGVPDLVYLNPYHMTVAKQKQGYRPLIRDKGNLSGIIVVKKDGPIKNIADLNGKTIAFPTPNALGASLFIRSILAEEFNLKINPVYVNGHTNVYRHVLLDEAAAGGGIRKTLDSEADAIKSQLEVIYSTPEVASHPLAAHPRVSAAVGEKIVQAMLALSINAETKPLLAPVQLPNPVAAEYNRDYAGLTKLKLERYAVIESK